MTGLPRKYAKMGFKKGWAAFRNAHKKTKNRGIKTMARHKRKRKSYFKRSRSSATKGFSMQNITKVVVGAALAALYEVFVSPMIPLDAMIKNIVELGGGLILAAMPNMPMPVRAFGAALATINAYSLIQPLISQYLGGASADANTGW